METSSQHKDLPKHIAIVMDGNGRWAKQRHLPVALGHKSGVEKVRDILEASKELGINNLTLFAFSSENWLRPAMEVKALMALFSSYLDNEIEALANKKVRLRFIGRRDRFSEELLRKIEHAEKYTSSFSELNLTLAVDYGGQWDITEAAKKIAEEVQQGKLNPVDITAELFSRYVCLADLPLPDLLIRTSGEYRISNFLLWQLAYAELYFTNVLWPDFDKKELLMAVDSFAKRDRRFGGRKEDVYA
jgi:undecaprenyl diphosphate synthase